MGGIAPHIIYYDMTLHYTCVGAPAKIKRTTDEMELILLGVLHEWSQEQGRCEQ